MSQKDEMKFCEYHESIYKDGDCPVCAKDAKKAKPDAQHATGPTITIPLAEYWILVCAAEKFQTDNLCWKRKCDDDDCYICRIKKSVLEGWRRKVGPHAVIARERVYAGRPGEPLPEGREVDPKGITNPRSR